VTSAASGPLAGLRVVDLTQVLAGPFCAMLLADLGADVIKVEPPGGDVARSWGPHVAPSASYGGYFASVNRNKRSICLDIKTAEGRAVLLDLLTESDVLLENFRVGVMERLGLSFEVLHERIPRLTYAAIRGFGDPRTGRSPHADDPAFDIVVQAMAGIMSITGPDADHPMKVGPGVGDIFPAALAAVGILAAVHETARTGVGRFVDVAMYDAVLALSERIIYQHSITGKSPQPQGNSHPLLCPYGVVRTLTGAVAIAAPSDRHWRLLATIMGRQELADDVRFATNAARLAASAQVYELIETWSMRLETDHVVRLLAGKVPCGAVCSAADIISDPHAQVRRMVADVEHPSGGTVAIVGRAIKFAGVPETPLRRAPLLGEHTSEVAEEMAALSRVRATEEAAGAPGTP
jgi:crotonobetainyl-CoA:carnitine CoA-transferase CaiB-like acyl-CoA transferase